MKKLFGVAQLEEARSCASSVKTHEHFFDTSAQRFRIQQVGTSVTRLASWLYFFRFPKRAVLLLLR
jgi:hypothetical protein